MKFRLIALLALIINFDSYAQKFKIDKIYKSTNDYYYYLSTFNKNHYFSLERSNLFLVNIYDSKKTRIIKTDLEPYFNLVNCKIYDGFIINAHMNLKERKSLYTTNLKENHFYLNTYKLETGKKLAKHTLDFVHPDKLVYYEIDTVLKKILVGVQDSVLKVYNYDLTEVPTDGYKMKTKETYHSYRYELYRMAQGKPTLNGEVEFNVNTTEISLYSKSYAISMQYYKDMDIPIFNRTFSNVRIKLKGNTDSFVLNIPDKKEIINIVHRELKNGNLILYGKYHEQVKNIKHYGFFSIVIDKNLQEVETLRFFSIVDINTNEDFYGLKTYSGLAYTDMDKPDFKFECNNSLIMTFQYNLYYLHDKIYVFELHDDGQITINYIVNRMQLNLQKVYLYKRYFAFQSNGKIHFLFYENMVNINKPANDDKGYKQIKLTKKHTVLSKCSYSIGLNELSIKTVVGDKKEISTYINLIGGKVYQNPENSSSIVLIQGMNKKGKYKEMYILSLIN